MEGLQEGIEDRVSGGGGDGDRKVRKERKEKGRVKKIGEGRREK